MTYNPKVHIIPAKPARREKPVGTIKVVDYFKSKKKKNEAEIAKAKEEIINGIKDYDAAHPDELSGK